MYYVVDNCPDLAFNGIYTKEETENSTHYRKNDDYLARIRKLDETSEVVLLMYGAKVHFGCIMGNWMIHHGSSSNNKPQTEVKARLPWIRNSCGEMKGRLADKVDKKQLAHCMNTKPYKPISENAQVIKVATLTFPWGTFDVPEGSDLVRRTFDGTLNARHKQATAVTLQGAATGWSKCADVLHGEVAAAEGRIGVMVSRTGSGHIRRNASQKLDNGFPNGEDMVAQFSSGTISMDMLLICAVDCLELLQDARVDSNNTVKSLIYDVMRPFHQKCQEWVVNRVNEKLDLMAATLGAPLTKMGSSTPEPPNERKTPAGLFWLSSQQVQLPAEVAALTEKQLLDIVEQSGEMVGKLHWKLVEQDKTNELYYGREDQKNTFLTLARFLLQFMVIAELSDPRCSVGPVPGTAQPFNQDHHREVLSSTRSHGRIQEGDEVVVIFPGLIFLSGEAGGLPGVVAKAYVTRLKKKK